MAYLQYTPFIWPFIFSFALSLYLAVNAFRNPKSPAERIFGWIAITLCFCSLTYLFEISAVTLAAKRVWFQLKFLGNAAGPVLWFALALHLTNRAHWLNRWTTAVFVGYYLFINGLTLSNGWHSWFITEVFLEPPLLSLAVLWGPADFIFTGVTITLNLLGILLMVDYFRKAPSFYRRQAALMTLATLLPVAGWLLPEVLGVNLFPQIDEIPLFLVFAAVLFGLAIFRFGAFEIVHIAHELVIQQIEAGIIVLDTDARIVDLNPYVQQYLDAGTKSVIGRPFADIFPGWPLPQSDAPLPEISINHDGLAMQFAVQISPIIGANQQLVGQTLMLTDITERKLAEQEKARLAQNIATLEERERMGRELHDDLGQLIGYLSVQAQTAQAHFQQQKKAETTATLVKLVEVAHQAQHTIRQYISQARRLEDEPQQMSFKAALDELNETLQSRHQFIVHHSLPDVDLSAELAPDVERQLTRIVQEGLANAQKHSGMTVASLIITLHENEVQAIIADQGQGFDPVQPIAEAEESPRFGLKIMQERAEAVGGTLTMHTALGFGTQLIVRLPRLIQTLEGGEEERPFSLQNLRVLLVDDHPLYLEGVHNLLLTRGVKVVGTAVNGLEAQRLADELLPDLILMDVQMPVCDGLEATQQIKEKHEQIKIVMLTVAAEDEKLFDALRFGASGYLLKSLNSEQFFNLISEVMRGETILSPSLAADVLTSFAKTADASTPASGEKSVPEKITLTRRQDEVMQLLVKGMTNKEIAHQLTISERTVKYHVGQVLERLHLKNRYELRDFFKTQGFADK